MGFRGYLLMPIRLWLLRKLIGLRLREYLGRRAAASVASVVMVGAVFGVKLLLASSLSLHGLLAACIVTGAVAYVVLIALLAPAVLLKMLEWARLALPREGRAGT